MELTDGELLARFLATGEQSAFEIVVRRHSALVFGICTRILGTTHDAEDAAQAVFLTLAHKASSLRQYGSIAGWLYRVAFNVAQRTREASQRRSNREREAGARMESQQAGNAGDADRAEWEELKPLLDTELHALPEKYRLPLILHYVEGRTQEEIATLMGCSYGAISGRLNHARNVLRERLQRRGLAVSPAVLFLLIPKFSPVALPEGIVTASAKAAVLIAAGNAAAPGLVSTQAAALTQGALRMMYMSKLKIAAVVLFGVVALTGAGVVTFHAAASDNQTAPRPTVRAAAPAAAATPAPAPAPAPTVTAGDKASDKPVDAAVAAVPKVPTAAEIQGWIGNLGSDDLATRTAAFTSLRNCGEAAREALTKAAGAKSRAGESATTLLAEIPTHAILQKVNEKAKTVKSVEANLSSSALAMGNAISVTASLKMLPAVKKMHMDMKATVGAMQMPMLVVCDGTTYWNEITMPAGANGVKMVMKYPASFMDDASNSNSVSPLSADKYETQMDFTEVKQDTLNGMEVYMLTGHLRPDGLEVVCKMAQELGGDMAAQMTKATMEEIDVARIYIGKDDCLVHKFEALSKDGKAIQMVELTDIKVNTALDDALFIYCPPAGVTVLDGIEQMKQFKAANSGAAPAPQAPPKGKDNF